MDPSRTPNKETNNHGKCDGSGSEKKRRLDSIGHLLSKIGLPAEVNLPALPENIDSKTKVLIDDKEWLMEAKDLKRIDILGKGCFGVVELMEFTKTGTAMAVKQVSFTTKSDKNEERRLLLFELDVNMRISTVQCPYTVHHYGAIYQEGKFWMCFEVMDTSLDLLYKTLNVHNKVIPEEILGKIAYAVTMALSYLHQTLRVIHRDVKPSNVLVNRKGCIKLCDYGISGKLIHSVARTNNIGCKAYMAPERINPSLGMKDSEGNPVYDVRSDVWSLAISLVELAIGRFPYDKDKLFEQIRWITSEPSPRLPADEFTEDFRNFIDVCLTKNYTDRPKYNVLLESPFLTTYRDKAVDVSAFIAKTLDDYAADYEKLRRQQIAT